MDIIYASNPESVGQVAARLIAREILVKPDLVLGLATGSTPIPTYRYLVRLFGEGLISFAKVRTFNLDEYVGLSSTHSQSYAYFMNEHLWGKVDLPRCNADIPSGTAPDIQAECQRYETAIKNAGGIDLQILGLGPNGHIGFNEPSHDLAIRTHLVDLTEATINANARFFDNAGEVPRQAITMGVGTIMQARKILLIVTGDKKRDILQQSLFGPVIPEVPASILRFHPYLTVVTDINLTSACP
ncbi:MAG: glucosamine-6-phosphate deaminase [Negativicutes bacterium]|nr:glucosamine-6-phosphate deaminase [Negativicutes bacterium]